jgi:hypothetical protein
LVVSLVVKIGANLWESRSRAPSAVTSQPRVSMWAVASNRNLGIVPNPLVVRLTYQRSMTAAGDTTISSVSLAMLGRTRAQGPGLLGDK